MIDPSSMPDPGSRLARAARRVCAAATLAAWALASAHSARADTLLVAPTDLLSGADASGYSVRVSGPGTAFVDLSSIDDAPGVQSDLSQIRASGRKAHGSPIDVTGWSGSFPPRSAENAWTLFGYVIGQANGRRDFGMFPFDVEFRPGCMTDVSPVPLPSSGWLLLGGLTAIGGMLRFGRPRWHTGLPSSG